MSPTLKVIGRKAPLLVGSNRDLAVGYEDGTFRPDVKVNRQESKGITQASGTKIILTGGAQAKNIFWQAAETVSIGTDAHFEGNILGKTNITLGTNASINGQLLAQTAVTLDKSIVVAP